MKYTRRQIHEAISYWQKQLLNESNIPVISSIKEFLNICKKQGIDVEKKKINKQGKVISAKIADKDQTIKSREGNEAIKKGSLIVDDGDGYFYAVPKEKISEFYIVNDDGSSITGDNTKWKKRAKQLEYYITPFDVDVKVNWQSEPLHALNGYSLVANDTEGKDISPVAPEKFKDPTLWKPISSTNESMYSRKQIIEAIAYWKKQLRLIDECQNRINEGKIGDFFGKLFKTQAWKEQQKEIKAAKESAEWEKVKKEHPFAKAAELIRKIDDDYKTTFGNIYLENNGYPIEWSGKGDVLIVCHHPSDYHDAAPINSIDDHPVIANSLKKAGIDANKCNLDHYDNNPYTAIIYIKEHGITANINKITKIKDFD